MLRFLISFRGARLVSSVIRHFKSFIFSPTRTYGLVMQLRGFTDWCEVMQGGDVSVALVWSPSNLHRSRQKLWLQHFRPPLTDLHDSFNLTLDSFLRKNLLPRFLPPDNTAGIVTKRNGFRRRLQEIYLLPVLIEDNGYPPKSSTGTLTIRVCGCESDGSLLTCSAEAIFLPVGLSTGALIAILLCIIILLGETCRLLASKHPLFSITAHREPYSSWLKGYLHVPGLYCAFSSFSKVFKVQRSSTQDEELRQ